MRAYIFFAIALLYVIFPFDLVPDFFGLIGRIDDLLVIVFLGLRYWQLASRARAEIEKLLRKEKAERESTQARTRTDGATAEKKKDPYEVLELRRGASLAEIKNQYRKLSALYHPDKVAHLGEELRALAHEKTIEIQTAYNALAKS